MKSAFSIGRGDEAGIVQGALGLGATLSVAIFFLAGSAFAQDAVNRAPESGASGSASATPAASNRPATQTTRTTQETAETEERLIIRGDELPSAYGAPGAFSRSRFSSITQAYVLPPGAVFAALIYEGDGFSEGPSDHTLTQEVEIGLPYRFGIAFENQVEFSDGDTSNRSFSIEARYALADWNKIPLNPTLFAEYKFGTGKILRDEGPEEEEMGDEGDMGEPDLHALRLFHSTHHAQDEDMGDEDMGDEGGPPDQPNAYEFRLLLSQDFGENVEWAFNAFLENETSGDRGREWGFAQSVQVPVILPHERLKAGVEMQYTNFTVKDTRGDPSHRFVIGPSASFKPTARMRFDLAPLFGVTKDSPDVQVFAVFSYVFGGGGGGNEAEAPTSTRNR